MIGHAAIHRAIQESFQGHGGDSRASLEALGFDNRAVDEYAERCRDALLSMARTSALARAGVPS